jgi:hypothetical protein
MDFLQEQEGLIRELFDQSELRGTALFKRVDDIRIG